MRQSETRASAAKPKEFTKTTVNEGNMRLPGRWMVHRFVFAVCVALCLLGPLLVFFLWQNETHTTQHMDWRISPAYKKQVHEHVHRVLEGQCQRGRTRQRFLFRLPASGSVTVPFLWKGEPLPVNQFLYPPPFGLKGVRTKVEDLLKLLENSDYKPPSEKSPGECKRCVVMGNGGILKGLELGPLVDRFDTVIRLNSGPLGEYSSDVGNRTSMRMSYPEGTPHPWVDTDPHALFVAVVYKSVDVSWIYAMIKKLTVSLWDRLFFWQKVPREIPLEPRRFRLLNPDVIRETSLDLLKYPQPRPRIWGWDKNVPTLGVTAVNLATLLCDEVSVAGFGYKLSQQGAPPLHYYDKLPMSAMLQQKMHDVDRETELLQSLVREGTITDLTGGIHCTFCSS